MDSAETHERGESGSAKDREGEKQVEVEKAGGMLDARAGGREEARTRKLLDCDSATWVFLAHPHLPLVSMSHVYK